MSGPTDPDLCDGCLALLGWCACEYMPPQGERRPARTSRCKGRIKLVAPVAAAPTPGELMTGHDPGDEHEDRP